MPNPDDPKAGDSTAFTVEAAVDRDSVEVNPLGKRAKDYGSAAVMICLLLAGLTWITILGSHYL